MPFLDYRVVEYIFSLPFESKIGHGFTKRILREAMSNKMNEEVRTRTFKVGIASPFEFWADNYLKEWLYKKVSTFNEVEREESIKSLDAFYKFKKRELLEKVWYKINLDLIKK